jgi:hypothetical protein
MACSGLQLFDNRLDAGYIAAWPAFGSAGQSLMSERKAREIIKAGVAWIDCALEEIREAA